MTATYLLDTSFLIAFERETESGQEGPAHHTLANLKGSRVFVSPVTVSEMLEGAEDHREALAVLARFSQLTIGWQAAIRAALNQSRDHRRMGENDDWQASLAVLGSHTLIGRDRTFEGRSWLKYRDFSKA